MYRFSFLLFGLFMSFSSCYAQENLIPIDNFVRDDDYAQPRLSPDGKYLALTVRIPVEDRFVPTIMVLSLPDMKQQGAVRMPAFEVPHSYYWVTNTRLLVTKAKELGSKERPYPTGEIFAMDYNGANQQYIYGYNGHLRRNGLRQSEDHGYGEISDFPSVKNGHFYMTTSLWEGERTMMFNVDSMNGNRKLIASIPISNASFVLKRSGKPQFAYAANKENYSVLYQFDESKNEWIKVEYSENKGYLTPFAFTDDDKYFYAFFRKVNEPPHLILQNFETGERKVLAENQHSELDLLINGIRDGIPMAIGTNNGIPSVKYLHSDNKDAQLHRILSSNFPESFVEFINYTDDGSKLLFAVRSDREPGAYYIFDQSTQNAAPLFASRQAIEPDQMAERRPISFTTRDGMQIDGYMTIPRETTSAKKMPMIVLPHGGPHGPFDKWFFDNDAQFLASRGYSVLQINFRGSGGRGRQFETAGWKKWGGEIQDDIIDGVKWAIREANVDANRICTYGASFGGYSALMLAVREPDMFKCAVGYVGVYDLNLMFTSDEAKDERFRATMTRYLGTDKTLLDLYSPAKHADRIKIPVMLVHGMDDKRATFNHAEAMRDALIKVGRPPEWMAIPGEGHGFYNTKNVLEFYTRLEAFLVKHLGK